MFTELTIQRLSAGTVFKLAAIGMACTFLPLCVFFGVLAAFGAPTITWNGQQLTGVSGLAMSPVIGLMITSLGTLFLGSACAFGLWIYSLVRPVSILVKNIKGPNAI
ncbi:hypothetical protein AEP_02993 [Curvibacter sp. AEP1-3]|nr:hypothetical protein AEP_02993 [Curvibacter sp. AEP1-3]